MGLVTLLIFRLIDLVDGMFSDDMLSESFSLFSAITGSVLKTDFLFNRLNHDSLLFYGLSKNYIVLFAFERSLDPTLKTCDLPNLRPPLNSFLGMVTTLSSLTMFS